VEHPRATGWVAAAGGALGRAGGAGRVGRLGGAGGVGGAGTGHRKERVADCVPSACCLFRLLSPPLLAVVFFQVCGRLSKILVRRRSSKIQDAIAEIVAG
jgi:hypothetical protein